MELQQKQLLESEGFQVIEGAFDFKFKTRTFIRHPDGRLNPYYDYLHQIPQLPNGQEFDLNKQAMPYDEIHGRPTAVKDAGAVTHAEFGLDARGLPIPTIVGYIILAVILLAIVICIYYIIHPPAQKPPCGTESATVDVSDCLKIVILPNCDSRPYDSCKEEWADDDWHGWTPPADWMTYLIIGVVAIGGVVIAVKVLPELLKKKKAK